MKQAYLLGVKDCERMYDAGYTFTELEDYVGLESEIGGYKWAGWCEGYRDAITHFAKLEEIANGEVN